MTVAQLQKRERISGIATVIMMFAAFYLIFFFAPTERTMGIVQKIFYIHVPAAFAGFAAFAVVAGYSIAFLRTRNPWHDRAAYAAAEVGVLFTTINLVTGMLWAKPTWNVYWSWDPRLSTLFILWFIYTAYLMLRKFVADDEKGARFAAVYAIVGTADIPIVYFSIWWWTTLHPQPVIVGAAEGDGMHPDIAIAYWFSAVTFLVFAFFLFMFRLRLEKSREQLEKMQRKIAFAE